MNAVAVIFYLCFAAIMGYYPAARRALNQIKLEDPVWYKTSGAKGGVSMSNSLAVISLMFDRGMPKPSYSQELKKMIRLARLLLAMSAGLLPAILVAMWMSVT